MSISNRKLIPNAFLRHQETLQLSLGEIMPAVQAGADLLLAAFRNNHRLFTCGNGGSAADSQHFAAECLCRYKDDRPPMPAIALTADTSALTAISNDYDFSHVFARKVHALGSRGDVLAAFSTSGKSKNVLAAIHTAKQKAMRTILLTGEGGREMEKVVDVVVIVPSRETARIQEIHQIVFHAWCEFIDAHFRSNEAFSVTIT